MMYEQNIVRTLYKKLLAFYPRSFREQLGRSMEQTFNDICKERQQTQKGLFGFLLWIFVETAVGIIQERIVLIKEMTSMKSILAKPALISLLLVLPFMIMEWINRRNFNEGFPIPLFGLMWLLPIIFIVTLTPIVQTVRSGNSVMAKPISLLFRVAFLLFIAWFWGSLVIDQLPCFLGVPNCD